MRKAENISTWCLKNSPSVVASTKQTCRDAGTMFHRRGKGSIEWPVTGPCFGQWHDMSICQMTIVGDAMASGTINSSDRYGGGTTHYTSQCRVKVMTWQWRSLLSKFLIKSFSMHQQSVDLSCSRESNGGAPVDGSCQVNCKVPHTAGSPIAGLLESHVQSYWKTAGMQNTFRAKYTLSYNMLHGYGYFAMSGVGVCLFQADSGPEPPISINATSAYWGFTTSDDRQRIEELLRRGTRAGYYRPDCPTLENLVENADDVLYVAFYHLLHSLLADKNSHGYELRRRRHDRILSHNDDQRNFVHRQIHKYSY